jgi:O-antigen/teichoic acid export membrane protein
MTSSAEPLRRVANPECAPKNAGDPGEVREPNTRLVIGNALLNCFGQAVSVLVGIATIPLIIRGLGPEAFGVLGLIWVLMGYFSAFDLGLGRATTKYTAQYLREGQSERLAGLIWTSLCLNVALGVLGGAVVAMLAPFLVDTVFAIPGALAGETRLSFYILAATLPAVLLSVSLRGVLEGSQRFDLVNMVKVPTNASLFVLPAVGAACGLNLSGVVVLLALATLSASLAYYAACRRAFLPLRNRFRPDRKSLASLFGYGSWVAVSSVVGPILVYLDRFLIASLLSVTALAYYTAPYEMIVRLWIIPLSLVAVLFPAFSALGASESRERLEDLYARSIKYLAVSVGPVVVGLIVFAEPLLQLWLGTDFARHSTLVMQILSVGVLANSLAKVPHSMILGLGRPDLVAKSHVAELVAYVGLVWFLTSEAGIAGAALAWTIRMLLDAALLFGLAARLRLAPAPALTGHGLWRAILIMCLLGGAAEAVTLMVHSELWLLKSAVFLVLLAVFALGVWHWAFDTHDRSVFRFRALRL